VTFLPFPTILVKQPRHPAPCAWNPLVAKGPNSSVTSAFLAGDDLIFNVGLASAGATLGTIGKSSGKLYFEIDYTAQPPATVGIFGMGISQASNAVSPYTFGGSGFGAALTDGILLDADTSVSVNYGASLGGSIGMLAVDFGALLMWVGETGTWAGGGNPAAGTGGHPILAGTYFPAISIQETSGLVTLTGRGNFSAGTWTYLPPPGFSQWR